MLLDVDRGPRLDSRHASREVHVVHDTGLVSLAFESGVRSPMLPFTLVVDDFVLAAGGDTGRHAHATHCRFSSTSHSRRGREREPAAGLEGM